MNAGERARLWNRGATVANELAKIEDALAVHPSDLPMRVSADVLDQAIEDLNERDLLGHELEFCLEVSRA